MLQYAPFAVVLLTIVGSVWRSTLRIEKRLATLEEGLKNHLAHHEGFEDKLSSVLEALLKKR